MAHFIPIMAHAALRHSFMVQLYLSAFSGTIVHSVAYRNTNSTGHFSIIFGLCGVPKVAELACIVQMVYQPKMAETVYGDHWFNFFLFVNAIYVR